MKTIYLNITANEFTTNVGSRFKIKGHGMNPVQGEVIQLTKTGFVVAVIKTDKWYEKLCDAMSKKIINHDKLEYNIITCKKLVRA